MNPGIRAKYVDYIAAGLRFIQAESGLTLPEETILIVKSYCSLSELNELIGLKVFVCDIPSVYDFFISFPAKNVNHYKLQKYFYEYLDTHSLALGD